MLVRPQNQLGGLVQQAGRGTSPRLNSEKLVVLGQSWAIKHPEVGSHSARSLQAGSGGPLVLPLTPLPEWIGQKSFKLLVYHQKWPSQKVTKVHRLRKLSYPCVVPALVVLKHAQHTIPRISLLTGMI